MRNNLQYIMKSLFLVFVICLCSITNSNAQTLGTKLQDVSISTPNTAPHSGALLELESNNKGMLVPRMTTGQRDAIPASKRTESLFIYNTTTGCFNYWSVAQATWLSLCGTPPPAVFNISSVQCTAIVANGTYKQGDALTNSNYLSVPVTVTQPGTYDVMATTTNGYFFTASGTFPSAGAYTIQLLGTGTPNSGYELPASSTVGDAVKISLNGNISNCEPKIFVEKANVAFAIDCGTVSQEGSYFVGIVTNETNKLKLFINVQSTGYWNIYTNTVNGISFSGTGTFTTTGIQQVELLSSGTPTAPGSFNYTIYSNSDPVSTCTGVQIITSDVAYTINCDDAVVNGSYMQAVATTTSNSITIPINVTATGNTTISTNTVNGISFTSGPITLSSLGAQSVVLNASGTPTNGTSTTLIVTGTPGGGATCNLSVPVSPQPVAYTMTCGTIAVSGSYAPGIAMNSSNTMTVTVNATYGGSWSIATDTQNGISFSGSGNLTVGSNTLVLTASGTPLSGGSFNYTLTSNSASGSTVCTKSVLFVYRTMKLLGLGGAGYQPASADPVYSAKTLLKTSANFGPNGTFPIQAIDLIDGAYNQGTALRDLINTNNIDIIFIGYNYNPNAASTQVLNDFVKNKKGVILHSQETGDSSNKALIDAITGGNVTVSGTGSTYYNPVLDVNDPLLNGPFGDVRLTGMGSDVNNSVYVTNVPSNVTVLAVNNNDANRAFVFKHNTLGYMFCGDSGWVAGTASNTSTDIWPARMSTSGLPLSKPYMGGTTVYNSFIYTNAIAWAIKYAQEHTIRNYQVQ